MNLFLTNTALAWLAGLIAVPLALHLFAKARPPRFLFSATAFVASVVRHTLRVKRPKDWLLLLVRTLLLAALMLVFLRPVLYRRGKPLAGGTARNMAIVVDRTASMAWTEGGRSRFAAACAEASRLLDSLSGNDTANVVWLDSEPEAVFPEMGLNGEYLKRQLAEARVSGESGNPEAAVSLALSLLKPVAGRRELYLISDFQASQWKEAKLDFPADVTVTTLSVAQGEAPNGAFVALRTEPLFPLAGDPVQVIAEVANFSSQPRARTVTFEIGETRLTRPLLVPPWGTAAAAAGHVFLNSGQQVVQASLDEEPFGADDWRGVLVPVRKALRVGIVGGDDALANLWSRALRAIPWTEPVVVPLEKAADAAACDLLMLAGWNGKEAQTLARLREGGLPLVCAPAAGLAASSLALLAGAPPVDGLVEWETLREPLGLTVARPEDPVFALFKDGDYGDPAKAVFQKRWKVPVEGLPGAALLAFSDGRPAVYRCTGATPLVIWAAPLSAEAGDWTAQLSFLPFFGELVGSLRARNTGLAPLDSRPGDRLTWTAPLQFEDVRLVDRQGEPVAFTAGETGLEGRLHVSAPIQRPGPYQWLAGEGAGETALVNFPVEESDLRCGPPPVGGGAGGGSVGTAADVQVQQDGTPLWPLLAWLGLAFLAVESALVLAFDVDLRRMKGENG